MDRADTGERLRLGGIDYLWQDGQLNDAQGGDIALRAKSLKLFSALLAEGGRVVSKEQLSDRVWPGVVATDESIARCVSDIRKVLGDTNHDIVETFPKQGYRLNVEAAPALPLGQSWKRRVRVPVLTVAAVSAVVAVTLAVWAARDEPAASVPVASTGVAAARTVDTVAILPFTADAEEDRFLADGLADDLEIRLAEVSGLRTLSQSETAVVSDAPTPAEAARQLDANYVVAGSVRQSASQLSLSLRLIDASDGATLWADRYEGSRDGLLAFRNSVPDALVSAMSVDLSGTDHARLAREDTVDPEAFEEVLKARRALSLFTYDGSLAAERHLRNAIARDPDYARAYAELAAAFVIRMENDWIVLSKADTDKAFYFAEAALRLDPDQWFAHYTLGRLHSVADTGDVGAAFRHLQKAMELQPDQDDPRIYYAIVRVMTGSIDEARRIFESVLATHPQPPFWYHLGYAHALFHQGHFPEALDTINHCLDQMPNSPYCLRTQIAILARMDRIDDAEWAIEEYTMLGHQATLDAMMKAAIERDASLRTYLQVSYERAGIR